MAQTLFDATNDAMDALAILIVQKVSCCQSLDHRITVMIVSHPIAFFPSTRKYEIKQKLELHLAE